MGVLVLHCCITNLSQAWLLKPTHFYYLLQSPELEIWVVLVPRRGQDVGQGCNHVRA